MSRRGPKRERKKARDRGGAAGTPQVDATRSTPPTLRVTLGGEDVSSLVTNMRVDRAVNKLASARFMLAAEPLASLRLDWQGEVVVDAIAETARRLFTGVITEAAPVVLTAHSKVSGVTAGYAVRCVTGVALTESTTGLAAHGGLGAADLMHVLLRGGGWTADRMSIQGDEALPTEVFEVYATVKNVSCASSARVGRINIINGSRVPSGVAARLPEHDLQEQFVNAEVLALTLVDAHIVQDALETGVRQIDEALAWLATRVQDGTTLRAGHYWPYRRGVTLAHPRRGDLVLVRGLSTGRIFVRGAEGTTKAQAIDVRPGALALAPPLPGSLAEGDRLAVLAWSRARADGPFAQRVQSLWDCLEFYAASTKVPRVFDDPQLISIRAALNEVSADATQRSRLKEMVGRLNDPPLMVKIVEAARKDGVGLSDSERALLSRLRKARNLASHGSAPGVGRDEDLRHGLSVVARLLAGRAARRAGYWYN